MATPPEDPSGRLAPLFTWRAEVMRSELPAMSKFVALALALYMNERGGSAFPSVPTLANDCSLGVSTVRASLKVLRERDWLVVVELGGIKGKRRRATEYQAHIPRQEVRGYQTTPPGDRARPLQVLDPISSMNSSETNSPPGAGGVDESSPPPWIVEGITHEEWIAQGKAS